MCDRADDATYIQRVLAGDREAFRALVENYSGVVYRIAYGMTRNAESAQDAVQEVFYRAYRGLEKFDREQPFGAWIRRIAVNYLLDQRKKKRTPTVSMTAEDNQEIDAPDESENPRDRWMKEERQTAVLQALQRLPEKYRMILTLRHFDNLSYEEIADTLAMPLGTVTTQIHRARSKLAELLHPLQKELTI